MKVLIATAKPFAAEAVQGIKKEFEGTGHEVVLLRNMRPTSSSSTLSRTWTP